jgi:hypothetical protein
VEIGTFFIALTVILSVALIAAIAATAGFLMLYEGRNNIFSRRR